jgi:hypothetical protein
MSVAPGVNALTAQQRSFEHDKALFKEARDVLIPQEGVVSIAFEGGEDSKGEPVLRIWVSVAYQTSRSRQRIEELDVYLTHFQNWLLDMGVQNFPYIRITESKARNTGRRRVAR